MHVKQTLLGLFSFIVFVFFSNPLGATDGYFSLGYGTKSKGLAGAGVGLYNYSLIGGNPAGNVFLGNEFDLGISLFMPFRQYTITGAPSQMPGFFGLVPGTIESDSKAFPIPHFGANWMIGKKQAFGIALFANGGMNTNYPTATFYDPTIETTGVNLAQMFMSLTYSRKLGSNHSIGIAPILAFQYFKAEGLTAFGGFSSDAASLSNNGTTTSFGYGLKVGYMGNLTSNLHIGAQFQTKIFMSEFDTYKGLFAEQGDFDIPMSWTAGLAYDMTNKLTVAFDVKQIKYSCVNAVGNPMDLVNNSPTDQLGNPNPNFMPLGTENGWGFGWEDMMVYKLGLEYELSETTILRGGFSYGSQPIPESEVMFNILAPGVIDNHLAVGLTKKIKNGNAVDFYFNYAFSGSVTGVNPLDFDPEALMNGQFVPNQDITLEMYQIDFGIGYTF